MEDDFVVFQELSDLVQQARKNIDEAFDAKKNSILSLKEKIKKDGSELRGAFWRCFAEFCFLAPPHSKSEFKLVLMFTGIFCA